MTVSKFPARSEALQPNIQEYIKQYIIEHRLTAGSPLPGEVEIANALHVSRNAVREAIKVLQTLGIVETRHGQGTFVGDLSMQALVAGLSFRVLFDAPQDLRTLRELLEIRQVLECNLIARLPQIITPAHLADLRLLVAQMEARAAHGELFAEEDRAFHEILYRPLGNNLIIQLLQAFWDIFHAVREQLLSSAEDSMLTVKVHQTIVNALAAGDGEAASAAMVAHFEGIRARLANSQ
ncbi:FadR/GntR family transcriptional regulator [Dictyobacter formicarum]|uniref:GntR family transcriptional regulator n=1 Tax=Dictyobacter formicarum TaxID=2778368 RepID=A0ABQ3VPB0_9CHLR|nr:FadR/GntR family transcriptional regulator [Dictyobacter formicarum]GHO87529.1 GntR family transcriptional regulator [Dictyobacter formicarum]